MTDSDIQREIDELDAELRTIDKALERFIEIASRNVWVKQGQPIPLLAEFHDAATKRTDDLLDKIKQLRERLTKEK
jgi:hypothetical protein